jgi:hypothetical protein
MVTLQAHTFHVLQPLDVNCFKPFKIAFKKEKNNAMVKNKLDKCTLVSWVDKSFNQSLSKKKFKNGFKDIGIWPLNLKVMEHKTKPFEIYITTPINISNENNDVFDDTTNGQE